ncbi:hypothetical protein MRB53_035812 [Persea americana]|uniref:Uncharacterized protein n=1 Tax=Persea americana TaxID=3435 RepID=A0ACC2K5S7_PERAE|nr:hypothetical protein MRB53_035812 [Persea americana]
MTLLLPLSERKPDRRPKSILEGIMGLGGKMSVESRVLLVSKKELMGLFQSEANNDDGMVLKARVRRREMVTTPSEVDPMRTSPGGPDPQHHSKPPSFA